MFNEIVMCFPTYTPRCCEHAFIKVLAFVQSCVWSQTPNHFLYGGGNTSYTQVLVNYPFPLQIPIEKLSSRNTNNLA